MKAETKKYQRGVLLLMIFCGLCIAGALSLVVIQLASGQVVPDGEAAAAGPQPVTIEVAAVGDNLMHQPLINSGVTDGGYNYDGFYSHVVPYLAEADLKAINQETVFVNNPSLFSGYPCFGGPTAVGESVVRAGFNVVEQASNHSYDKGLEGLSDTIAFWKSQPVTLLGVNETPEDALRVDKFEKDGFTLAMMNYTYGLNGFVLPEGAKHMVNLLDEDARPAIAEQIARAKAESDMVIVFPHWGTEYMTAPDEFQRDWLRFFNENGVDIIIGAHPHVLQPVEEFVGETGYKTLVFYSLGNFISNQDTVVKELGGMARITLVKDEFGCRVEKYSLEPLFTHLSGGKYTVYMLRDYTDELARTHAKYGGGLNTAMIWDKFYDIAGRPEQSAPAVPEEAA